jgi:hypothetical protein
MKQDQSRADNPDGRDLYMIGDVDALSLRLSNLRGRVKELGRGLETTDDRIALGVPDSSSSSSSWGRGMRACVKNRTVSRLARLSSS